MMTIFDATQYEQSEEVRHEGIRLLVFIVELYYNAVYRLDILGEFGSLDCWWFNCLVGIVGGLELLMDCWWWWIVLLVECF